MVNDYLLHGNRELFEAQKSTISLASGLTTVEIMEENEKVIDKMLGTSAVQKNKDRLREELLRSGGRVEIAPSQFDSKGEE